MPVKPKHFHHVTIQAFVRGEEPNDALARLDFLLPIPTAEYFAEQPVQNPERPQMLWRIPEQQTDLSLETAEGDESGIIIAELFYKKITHTNAVFDRLLSSLPEQDKAVFTKNALKYVRDGKLIVRLDDDVLRDGKAVLARSGTQFSFSIAAYPKNEETIRAAVQAFVK